MNATIKDSVIIRKRKRDILAILSFKKSAIRGKGYILPSSNFTKNLDIFYFQKSKKNFLHQQHTK